MRRLLTIAEAAGYLGIKKKTLYGMTSQRRIPYVKIDGKLLRFDQAELDAWVEEHKVEVFVPEKLLPTT